MLLVSLSSDVTDMREMDACSSSSPICCLARVSPCAKQRGARLANSWGPNTKASMDGKVGRVRAILVGVPLTWDGALWFNPFEYIASPTASFFSKSGERLWMARWNGRWKGRWGGGRGRRRDGGVAWNPGNGSHIGKNSWSDFFGDGRSRGWTLESLLDCDFDLVFEHPILGSFSWSDESEGFAVGLALSSVWSFFVDESVVDFSQFFSRFRHFARRFWNHTYNKK